MKWFMPQWPIRLPRAPDHSFSKIFFGNFRDLVILLRLDDMGIHAPKIRVDLTASRAGGENDVALVDWPYAWK